VSDQRSSYSGGRSGYQNRDNRNAGRGRRSYYSRPRTCSFCGDKEQKIDYKNYDLLRRYVHEDGKIRPRRQSGNCAKHQRKIAIAIKRARHLALLPFTGEVLR
jgi:small subunit ribosomal protein S18